MPTLYVPIRLHSQDNHSYRAGDVIILSTVYEGATYPKVIALQPNRREQRHLINRANYMKTIGQIDYRVWEVVARQVYGHPFYHRVGHGMLRSIRVTVAPANQRISPIVQQAIAPHLRQDVNTPRMLAPPPWPSRYDDTLIVRVQWQ